MLDDIIEILLELVLDGAMEAVDSPKVPMPLRIFLGGLVLGVALSLVGLIAWVGISSGSILIMLIAAALLVGVTILVVRKVKKFKKERKEENWL